VIVDEIGDLVRSSVAACDLAALELAEGRLEKAAESARKAFGASETAFFDPSLLALLYFPSDQK